MELQLKGMSKYCLMNLALTTDDEPWWCILEGIFSCSEILALSSGAGHPNSHVHPHYDDLKGMKVLLNFHLPLPTWPYQIASWLPTILQ